VKLVGVSATSNPTIADATKSKKLGWEIRVKASCSPLDARDERTGARIAKSKEGKAAEIAAS
jgi:hypothetical protein